jgi:hypothetical protein
MKYIFIARSKPYKKIKYASSPFGICQKCRKFRKLVLFGSYCENPLCDDIPF